MPLSSVNHTRTLPTGRRAGAGGGTKPKVLVVSTTIWPLAARLAMEFDAQGWAVGGVCLPANPLHSLNRIGTLYRYGPLKPGPCLARAIAGSRPDVIVPADERAIEDLRGLFETSTRPDAPVSAAVKAALQEHHGSVTSPTRWELIQAASDEGIVTPACMIVTSDEALAAFAAPFPWVVKADGTWGGKGVKIVSSLADAKAAIASLEQRPRLLDVARNALLGDDPFLLRALAGPARTCEITVQAYVRGRPANCAVACVDGRLIDIVSVEVLRTEGETGPASVVRLVDDAAMRAAAARLVWRFGLTGLFGFDFMIESGSKVAHLIEMNSRPTRLCHLPLRDRGSLIAAFSAAVGTPSPSRRVGGASIGDLVTYFPQVWQSDPRDPLLETAYHDAPWEEPALLRHCLAPPRRERIALIRWGLKANAVGRGLRRGPGAAAPFPTPGGVAPSG